MKILLRIPTIDGKIPVQTFQFLIKIKSPNITIATTSRQVISIARNLALKKCVEEGFDALVMLDDDNPPAYENFSDVMASHGVDYVSGIVRQRGDEELLNICKGELNEQGIMKYVPYKHPKGKWGDLVEVENCGSACTFLSRKLCEEVMKYFASPYEHKVIEYFKTKDMLPTGMKRAELNYFNLGLYEPELGEHGMIVKRRELSEDYLFGERVRQLGHKIYCDTRIKCVHIGKPKLLYV